MRSSHHLVVSSAAHKGRQCVEERQQWEKVEEQDRHLASDRGPLAKTKGSSLLLHRTYALPSSLSTTCKLDLVAIEMFTLSQKLLAPMLASSGCSNMVSIWSQTSLNL